MKYIIEIELGSDELSDDALNVGNEIMRIIGTLHLAVAAQQASELSQGPLMDRNGNTVGRPYLTIPAIPTGQLTPGTRTMGQPSINSVLRMLTKSN